MGLIRTIVRRGNKQKLGNVKAQLLSVKAEKRKFETAARHALREVGKMLTKESKALILNPPKTGRIYRYKGRKHQASKGGEAPANRSGKLRKSVFYRVESFKKLTVGATIFYAAWLEEGTSRMEARPYMQPVIDKNEKKINAIFRKRLNTEVKRG